MGMATGQQPPMPGQARRAPGMPLQGGKPMMPQGGPPRSKQTGATPPNPAMFQGQRQPMADFTKMQGMPGYGAPMQSGRVVNAARIPGGPTSGKQAGAMPPQFRR